MDQFPTALELARLIRSKEISPVEVLDETIARIDTLNPALNAVIWRNDDDARAEAKRQADIVATEPAESLPPFLGVPLPIKDLTAAAGQPLTHGSNGASDELQAEDELTVAAFRRAGFNLTGRTNSPEFGTITATENERYGITRNPWNTDHTPGGSSGGAAAVTSAGMFAIGHGGDGGGSLRIPGSCCGLVGMKVSRGRVPTLVESWEGAAVEGVVSHTVADTAAILDLIAQPDPLCWYNAPAARAAVRRRGRCRSRRTAHRLARSRTARAAGGRRLPRGRPRRWSCVGGPRPPRRAGDLRLRTWGHGRVHHRGECQLHRGRRLDEGLGLQPGRLPTRLGDQRGRLCQGGERVAGVVAARAVAAWGRDFDVLLSPTLTIEPPPAGQILGEITAAPEGPPPTVMAMVAFTAPFNLTGLPAVSLPLHQAASGLPIGVQLVERPFNDAGLIRLASQLEAAMPWRDRHPAL